MPLFSCWVSIPLVCVCVFATAMADYKVGRALILRLLCTSISPQPEGSHNTQVFGSFCWIQWITLWCQVWFKFAFHPQVLPNFIAADASYLWRMLRAGTGSHLLRVKNPGTESQEAGFPALGKEEKGSCCSDSPCPSRWCWMALFWRCLGELWLKDPMCNKNNVYWSTIVQFSNYMMPISPIYPQICKNLDVWIHLDSLIWFIDFIHFKKCITSYLLCFVRHLQAHWPLLVLPPPYWSCRRATRQVWSKIWKKDLELPSLKLT